VTTTIELLRHAEAVGRDKWWGRPDAERPLDEAGRRQSEAIARALAAGAPIGGLYSSPSLRCVATLDPLAAALGLDVGLDDGLAEASTLPVLDGGDAWVSSAWLGGRGLALVERLLVEHAGARLVACSHGDVIPAIMAALVGRDGLGLTDVRCPKGAWFTLTFEGSRCMGARLQPGPGRP
jgi:8-oxo-dGTP diphosphatase